MYITDSLLQQIQLLNKVLRLEKKYYSKDKKMIKCQFDKILGLFMVLNLIKHNL